MFGELISPNIKYKPSFILYYMHGLIILTHATCPCMHARVHHVCTGPCLAPWHCNSTFPTDRCSALFKPRLYGAGYFLGNYFWQSRFTVFLCLPQNCSAWNKPPDSQSQLLQQSCEHKVKQSFFPFVTKFYNSLYLLAPTGAQYSVNGLLYIRNSRGSNFFRFSLSLLIQLMLQVSL